MDIIDLLAGDNFIIYNKEIAKLYGIEEAILLGAMCGYQKGFKNEEFYREQEKILEDTSLTLYGLRKALKTLVELNIITYKKKGIPAKFYYKVNAQELYKLLMSRVCENDRSSTIENNRSSNIENNSTNNKNNNKNNDNNKYNEIFDFWNSKNIIKHSKLNDLMIKEMKRVLKDYSVEHVKLYIGRYSNVINDKSYFFNTKWTLNEFLKQKNAMLDFTDEGSKWLNYISFKAKNNISFKAREYTQKEVDNLYDNLDEINL